MIDPGSMASSNDADVTEVNDVADAAEAKPPWAAGGAQSDRRASERKPLRTRAQLHFTNRPPMEVRVIDLNSTGLGIVAPENLPVSTTFTIQWVMVSKHGIASLKVSARVVHNVFSGAEAGFKLGLQFQNMPASAADAVAKYLAIR